MGIMAEEGVPYQAQNDFHQNKYFPGECWQNARELRPETVIWMTKTGFPPTNRDQKPIMKPAKVILANKAKKTPRAHPEENAPGIAARKEIFRSPRPIALERDHESCA